MRALSTFVVLALVAACGSSGTENAAEPPVEAAAPVSFAAAFADRLAIEDLAPKDVCPPGDPVAERVLTDYGAVFVPIETVEVMPRCVFENSMQVEAFHRTLTTESGVIDDKTVTLQAQAFAALEDARADARSQGLTITPRGPFPAARDFTMTVDLWTSRVEPALAFWSEQGRLTDAEVARVENADPIEQVEVVFSFEQRGLFFSTEFDRSILTSVAAPGTSQHLSLLAFDVVEHEDPAVRRVLAAHGWYSTVADDPPHFTFLGHDEADLPAQGLERVTSEGRTYWVPAT